MDISMELVNAYMDYKNSCDKESFDNLEKVSNKMRDFVNLEAGKYYPHRNKCYWFTEEEDKWLTENFMKYNRKPQQLCDDLNAKFGTKHTKHSVARRRSQLSLAKFFFTVEQEEWLKERFYLDRPTLTDKFNKKFGTMKTVYSISSKMNRMKAYMK